MEVVSIGTGTSCLGKSQLSKDGSILHDCHAEIIAKKAFQRYLFKNIFLFVMFIF